MWNRIKLDSEEIVKLYQSGLSAAKIGKKFNTSNTPIYRILKEEGVQLRSFSEMNRKYKVNETYFDVINSHEKAYILGLIYADGCNKVYKNTIDISLHKKDVDILKKIKNIIQPDKPLGFSKKMNQYSFRIENKHISKQLELKGVIQAKSLKITFPTKKIVPKKFVHSFVLGYFDGDGSLSISKQKYNRGSINITGTENFVDHIIRLSENIKCNWYKYQRFPERNNNNYTIQMCGSVQSIRFLKWMYKDSPIFMQRKHDTFNKLLFTQLEKENRKQEIKNRKQEDQKKKEDKYIKYKKEYNMVISLYKRGKSIREIQDLIGVDRRKSSKYIKEQGINIKMGGWNN